MGTPKISTFIISLVWIGFFASVFTGLLAGLTSEYGVDSTNLNISTFNKLQQLDTQTEELKESVTSFNTETGVTDIIGSYFTNGYQTLKTAGQSMNVFFSLTNDALESPGLDLPILSQLKTSLVITVLVFMVIGVMLSAILKKDV